MTQAENIYSTVPDDHNPPVDRDARIKIMELLKGNPKKFFTAAEIARRCGLSKKGTQVEVRKAITELIEIYQQPIVSTGSGFAYTEEYNMLINYCERLTNRVQGINRRITALRNIAIKYRVR